MDRIRKIASGNMASNIGYIAFLLTVFTGAAVVFGLQILPLFRAMSPFYPG